MRRCLVGLFCTLSACTVMAAGPTEVRKHVVASMLVTGSVEFSPNGHVLRYAIDQQEKLAPVVLQVIGNSMPTWDVKFGVKPGGPEKASMTLRLLARPLDNGHTVVSIAGADLVWHNDDGQSPQAKTPLTMPAYPGLEAAAGVTGTAYVLAQLDRHGRVAQAMTEQVNLGVYSRDTQMDTFREDFAAAAVEAVKRWRFTLPTEAKDDADVSQPWLVRIPIVFVLHDRDARDQPGQWQAYIPGPRMPPPPWIKDPTRLTDSVDVAAAGHVQLLRQGPRLTIIQGKTTQSETNPAGTKQGGR